MFLFGKKERDGSDGREVRPQLQDELSPFAQAERLIAQNPSGIKILGTNGAVCLAMKTAFEEALARAGSSKTAEYIDDLNVIAAYGVIHTPAVAADGKLVSSGRVLTAGEIAAIVKKHK